MWSQLQLLDPATGRPDRASVVPSRGRRGGVWVARGGSQPLIAWQILRTRRRCRCTDEGDDPVSVCLCFPCFKKGRSRACWIYLYFRSVNLNAKSRVTIRRNTATAAGSILLLCHYRRIEQWLFRTIAVEPSIGIERHQTFLFCRCNYGIGSVGAHADVLRFKEPSYDSRRVGFPSHGMTCGLRRKTIRCRPGPWVLSRRAGAVRHAPRHSEREIDDSQLSRTVLNRARRRNDENWIDFLSGNISPNSDPRHRPACRATSWVGLVVWSFRCRTRDESDRAWKDANARISRFC